MNLDQIGLPLFLPATRMDRLPKALASGADAVIIDLEDAVSPKDKENARAALKQHFPSNAPIPILVRINGTDSAWYDDDVAICGALSLSGIMLSKADDPTIIAALAHQTDIPIVGLIESAMGLHRAVEIANITARLAFGSIDFAAELGLAHEQIPLAHARAQLVLAAHLASQSPPWDGVTMAIDDDEAIEADCRHSIAMGFGGKLLIHPAQIPAARRGFAPTPTEQDWANRVIDATHSNAAAIKLDGQMIDAPVIKRAHAILARARKI